MISRSGYASGRALAAALFFFFTLAAAAAAQEKYYDVPLGDSPSLGPPDAPITIVEFLDFQ